MAQAVAEDVRAFADEFAGLSDPKLNLFLEYARRWVHETKWGDSQKLAEVLMCAHLLTMQERARGGVAGPVTAERVGDVNISYGSTTVTGDEALSTTSYGQQFIELRKTLLITPIVV